MHSIRAVNARRRFLSLIAAAISGWLAGACGVKGPLYLPEDSEEKQKKDKDDEAVSERSPATDTVGHG